MDLNDRNVREIANAIGMDWIESNYYDDAEQYIDEYWDNLIWPFIKGNDFSCVIDLAAGHGRNTRKLKEIADRIIIADINQENIDFCKNRFKADSNIEFVKNDGTSLEAIGDSTITFIYCFDAMVHFDSDVIRLYLREFNRILKPESKGFCHHSNYTKSPDGDFHNSPGWRNYMSDSLFHHYCHKEGLKIIDQKLLNWTHHDSDCFSLFEKI